MMRERGGTVVVTESDQEYVNVAAEQLPARMNVRSLVGALTQRSRDEKDDLLAAFLLVLPPVTSPLEVLAILEECVMEAKRDAEAAGGLFVSWCCLTCLVAAWPVCVRVSFRVVVCVSCVFDWLVCFCFLFCLVAVWVCCCMMTD